MTSEAISYRGSRKKTIWRAPNGQQVEITERQKEIMDLSDSEPSAQAVAQKLGITPNAVYVARRRVKEQIEASGDGNGDGIKPFAGPRRVVSLERYEREQGVNVEAEVQEVARMIQDKISALTEAEERLVDELEQIRRTKDGFSKMLSNVLDDQSPSQDGN